MIMYTGIVATLYSKLVLKEYKKEIVTILHCFVLLG